MRREIMLGLAVASVPLFAVSADSFGQTRVDTRTIRVGGTAGGAGTAAPAPVNTVTVAMPTSGSGSALQATLPISGGSNLGTFDIIINPGAGLAGNAAALAAFNRAAQRWEALISDPITVRIDADLAPLGPGILGSTGSELLTASFTTIRNAMVADSAGEVDDGIVAFLPTAANYNVTLPAGFGLNGNVFASKANLKALGFDAATLDGIVGTTRDATITFSSNFAFDLDNSNGITGGQFDFEGVAAHEIGHALGFFSGVDDVDFVLPGTANNIEPTPLDMFRFRDGTNDPATAADFANGTLAFPRNMVPQHIAITDQILGGFGGDIEMLMSQGVDFGDGQQASHFKDNLGLGLMDPTAAAGQLLVFSDNDYRAMDLIGYDLTVPEPATAGLLAFVGMAAAARRRRR